MNYLKALCIFFLISVPFESTACSIARNQIKIFERTNSTDKSFIPAAPKVFVNGIVRGGDMPDSCNDIAFINIAIPADEVGRELGYKFKLISGKPPAKLFHRKAVTAGEYDGKLMFSFGWVEGGRPLSLDFTVRVTAYSKSGKKGGFTDLRITHAGR